MNKKECAKPAIVAKSIDAEPMLAAVSGGGVESGSSVVDGKPEVNDNDNQFSKENTFTSVWDD